MSNLVECLPVLAKSVEIYSALFNFPCEFVLDKTTSPEETVFLDQSPKHFLIVGKQIWVVQGKFHESVRWRNIPEPTSQITDTIRVPVAIGQEEMVERIFYRPFNETADGASLAARRDLAQISQFWIEPHRNGLSAREFVHFTTSLIDSNFKDVRVLHVYTSILIRFVYFAAFSRHLSTLKTE